MSPERQSSPYPPERQFFQIGNGGAPYACVPGAVNIFDLKIDGTMVEPNTKDVYLFGGEYWTDANVLENDYVEFSVVDKDNVLGYHTKYGLTPGVDVIELAKYIRKRPLVPSTKDKIESGNAVLLREGLYLRTIYNAAAGGQNRIFKVAYFMAK